MSVSSEYLALADQAVLRTFEQTCVSWRAIPHWDTQNPGQTRVRADRVFAFEPGAPASLPLCERTQSLEVTLARATAPTPDPLLGSVIAATVELAAAVDRDVWGGLAARGGHDGERHRDCPLHDPEGEGERRPAGTVIDALLESLLDGHDLLEDAGYRADSCLVTGSAYHRALHRLVDGVGVADEVLRTAAIGAQYRSRALDGEAAHAHMVMIGRRQDMPGGSAAQASAGEEPVDLAISVAPGVEVVGDTAGGAVELAVRVRYALRVKDDRGVAVFHA